MARLNHSGAAAFLASCATKRVEMDIVSPANNPVPQAALTRCLRELPNCVVLRNEKDLFDSLHRGGDVDLLVGDLELAELTLIRHLGPPVRIIKSSYVTGYSYDWGHIDLLPTIEWRGACFVRTEAVLESRQLSARGLPVPRIAHEASISWLTSLLFGGFFKERYAPEIRRAVEIDGDAFRQTLIEAAGKKLGVRLWQAAVGGHPEVSAGWTRSLRRAVWWRAFFRSPVRTIRRSFAFVIGELRLRFEPPVPWMAILGSDRKGTSFLANEIVQRSTVSYANITAFHWRPRLIARAQSLDAVANPQGRPCRGPIGSGLNLLVLAADWLVGYWTRLVHLRAKGYVLTFDGMYFDLLVDPKRYQYGGGPRLVRVVCWVLPKPDLVFVLDSEPDLLWHREPDVPRSELARQRGAYNALARELPGGHVLNGNLPLNVLIDEVQRVIRAWMSARSLASVGGTHAPLTTTSTPAPEGSTGTPSL